MLEISSNSWHYRAYNWWHEQKYGWRCDDNFINLCPYGRAALLWSWLRFLMTGKYISGFFWGLCASTLPVLCGYINPTAGLGVYVFYAYTASFVVLTAAGVGLANLRRSEAIGNAKFLTLIVAYVRGLHDMVCPMVKINRPEAGREGNYDRLGVME